ncbi:hypothetical protein [Methylopila sp. 73B]|uniref:hypothetical protein n=1 Tax=Methylopila sp. 73B TaxID=1120792 RepID=UPI00037EF437|nr:hypothetical protein [Methylopila sp. 73B]
MSFEISIETSTKPSGGVITHFGTYEVSDGMITVREKSTGRTKMTQLGGTPAETLAKMLLREIVQEARA